MVQRRGRSCPWLSPRNQRRTIKKDVTRYLGPEDVYQLIISEEWPYKCGKFTSKGIQYGKDFFHARDRALMALMYLTSGRINEVLRVTKDQFKEMKDLTHKYPLPDPDFLILEDFWISKRKKGKSHPLKDLPLPRKGRLSPFTELVEKYLSSLDKDEALFHFGKSRAWVIVNYITGGYEDCKPVGKWNHWFRAESLSYLINLQNSAMRVAEQRGIENPNTIKEYYKGQWIVDREVLKRD